MGNVIDTNKIKMNTRLLTGRKLIKSSVKDITRGNVIDVLHKALDVHRLNRSDIDYLYKYYCGVQPILYRQKEVRPDICNKIVVNIANEIVSFKVGYLYGEPIQYVSRSGEENVVSAINTLNEMMFAEDKATADQEIGEWNMICGTAYRMVLPDKKIDEDECPFEIYTLDPRDSFVVYSTELGNKPLMGVKCSVDDNNISTYSIYTKTHYFLITNDIIIEERQHALGDIPIFEYPANNARLGAFEIVLPLLDAINNVESNRLDGVEQIVQAFIKFINCDINKEEYEEFIKLGAIKVNSSNGQKADVNMVTTELSQSQSQALKDDLYNAVLTVCGMPNRNGGSSTSDTGSAVILRDGWSAAETRAKDSENVFKKAEKKMLKLVLRICRELSDLDLYLKDIELKFTRRNYENIQSKSQVLISMLQQEKIHPQLAFQHSGMFSDAESAYSMSKKYYEETQEKHNKMDREVDNRKGADLIESKYEDREVYNRKEKKR